jgi:hypothetical protein
MSNRPDGFMPLFFVDFGQATLMRDWVKEHRRGGVTLAIAHFCPKLKQDRDVGQTFPLIPPNGITRGALEWVR